MNAHSLTFATWTETLPSGFSVSFGDASFGVGQEGATYYLTLPGRGIRKCWNRNEVERVCLEYLADLQGQPDDEGEPFYGTSSVDFSHQFAKEAF